MKTIPSPGQRQSGSVLMLTLVITGLIGLSLASYLTLVSTANRSVFRSQTWNATIPLIEAGIEEALAHLNRNCFTNEINSGTVNWTADGWTRVSDGVQRSRPIGDGYYIVTILDADPINPVVVSEGFSPAPLAKFFNPFYATAGTYRTGDEKYVSRKVRATTRLSPLFTVGMFARGQIDLRGNNVRTDSFDSTNPAFSTNGRYDPNPAKIRDNGDVATNSGLVNSLNVGNADIMGKVATGPGGSVGVGSNGSVGDKNWVLSGQKGIQEGRVSDDMNIETPDVDVPFTSGLPLPGSQQINGVSYDHVFVSGDYRLTSGQLKGNILVMGNVRIFVGQNAEVALTGQDRITVSTNGASLKLYVASARARISGNGIVNDSGRAMDFQYFGLPTNREIDFGGNAAYTGLIYAPNADFSMGGGGNNTYDFVGASITGSVKMNGHFNFHYDESIARFGPRRGFILTSWIEE